MTIHTRSNNPNMSLKINSLTSLSSHRDCHLDHGIDYPRSNNPNMSLKINSLTSLLENYQLRSIVNFKAISVRVRVRVRTTRCDPTSPSMP